MAFGIAIDRVDGLKSLGDLTNFRRVGDKTYSYGSGAGDNQSGTDTIPTYTEADLTGTNFVLIAQASLLSGTVVNRNFVARIGSANWTDDITVVTNIPTSVNIRYQFFTGGHTGAYSIIVEIFAMEI